MINVGKDRINGCFVIVGFKSFTEDGCARDGVVFTKQQILSLDSSILSEMGNMFVPTVTQDGNLVCLDLNASLSEEESVKYMALIKGLRLENVSERTCNPCMNVKLSINVNGIKCFEQVLPVGIVFLSNQSMDGLEPQYHKNGFHFAIDWTDTLRYNPHDTSIALVVGFGLADEGVDEYNGNYDLFCTSNMIVLKYLTKEELLAMALNLTPSGLQKLLAGLPNVFDSESLKLIYAHYSSLEPFYTTILQSRLEVESDGSIHYKTDEELKNAFNKKSF